MIDLNDGIDPDDDGVSSNDADGKRDDDDILKEARLRYRACGSDSDQNRIDAISDLNFLVGGKNQWDDNAYRARELAGLPTITVNSLPTYLHQVTNDQRMNTPAIKVHPVGDGADIETAKIRQGVIRHIEYDSNADVCYDTAVNSAAAIGFGYFGLITEYESATSWNQKIRFRRIRNAMSVRIDPLSIEPDGSDMTYAYIELKMAKSEFKIKWPDAKACASSVYENDSAYAGWLNETEVLVCDYYCIETEEAEVVLLSNGESGFKDDLLEIPEGVTIVKNRKSERKKVMLYKITGVDILDRTEIKCNWIPVFPVYGDEIDIQGQVVRSGIIRHAKGPCQMYNVFMSSATQEVGARSKTPYIGAEGQFAGYESEWADASSVFPYREYKPVTLDGHLVPAPQRAPMADIPAGWLMLASHASDNIKKTTGLFDASLGARGTATSGVQERAQQAEGDMANFHYADGLLRTIRHAGRCLDCMITNYMDGEQVAKIMSDDNKASSAVINKVLQDGSVLHDMTCQNYSVTVTAGASYSTLRQENSEFFAKAMQSAKDPATASVVTYLAMKNNDAPDADEATKMLKALLPPQVISAMSDNKDEPMVQTSKGPLPVSQVPQALSAMEQHIQQLTETLQKLDQGKQQLDLMKQQQVLHEQQLEPGRQQAEQMRISAEIQKAKTAQLQAEADMVRAQSEAAVAPQKAQAEIHKQAHDAMMAEAHLMNANQKLQVDAAVAEAESLSGNLEALEVWKATLEAETRIRVAEISARASAARANSQSKGNSNAKAT